MRYAVKDNFFEEPDFVREIGINLRRMYRASLDIDSTMWGWRGLRSIPLENIWGEHKDYLDNITKKVFNYVWDTLDLKNYKYSDSQKHIEEPHITSYYHFLTNQALKSLPDFHQDKFHKDDVPCAGIVYLSPNPPKNSGTAILDEKNNRFDIIENKYNRLLCYDGMLVHGPCNTFGIDKKTGRMTFTFFIHEIKLTGEFD